MNDRNNLFHVRASSPIQSNGLCLPCKIIGISILIILQVSLASFVCVVLWHTQNAPSLFPEGWMVGILDYNNTINFNIHDEAIPPQIVVDKVIKMLRHKIMVGIVSHVGQHSPHRETIQTFRDKLAVIEQSKMSNQFLIHTEKHII